MKLSETKELLNQYNGLNCWLSNKRTYPFPVEEGLLTHTKGSNFFNVGFRTYDINRIVRIVFGDITSTVYITYD